jgi:hypothetical protein
MKKKILLLYLILVGSTKLYSSSSENDIQKDKYYWFYLRIESALDEELNYFIYQILEVSPGINCGSISKFTGEFKSNLKKKIYVIGPYRDSTCAQTARTIYNDMTYFSDKEIENLIKTMKSKMEPQIYFNNYYGCYTRLSNKYRNSHKLVLQRVAARNEIEVFTFEETIECIRGGLDFEMLFVGFFSNRMDAEESERIQRQLGEKTSFFQNIKYWYWYIRHIR